MPTPNEQAPRPNLQVAARVEELLREQLEELGVNPRKLAPEEIAANMHCHLAPNGSMTYIWKGEPMLHVTPEKLVDENGEQMGILPIRQALDLAEERQLDLVKIAPQAKEDGKGELYFLVGEKELTGQWQEFTVSFVPADQAVVFGLFASSGHPVDYDDIKVVNGSAYNTSFERINSDNEIDGWRYYSPGTVKANAADAADGRVYITCSRTFGMRQAFYMKPGQRAVISFKARIGRELQLPPHNGWASKNIRKMR